MTSARLVILAAAAALLAACSSASSSPTPGGASSPAVPLTPSIAAATSSSPANSASPSASGSSSAPSTAAASSTDALSTCDPSATVVPQTEGPYYTPGAPERADVTDEGTVGTPLLLTGVVFDSTCAPVAGARLDFWQADGSGRYDNSGFGLRGYQLTDAQGRYSLTTVIPGQYPGRTEHIHLKVTPPAGSTITSQLYFPGAPGNEQDRFYVASMEISINAETDAGMSATYNLLLP